MHPLDFPLLADENIHPDVVRFLREQHGADICSVSEEGLAGQDDTTLLRCACQENRVVLTHDSDMTATSAHWQCSKVNPSSALSISDRDISVENSSFRSQKH